MQAVDLYAEREIQVRIFFWEHSAWKTKTDLRKTTSTSWKVWREQNLDLIGFRLSMRKSLMFMIGPAKKESALEQVVSITARLSFKTIAVC